MIEFYIKSGQRETTVTADGHDNLVKLVRMLQSGLQVKEAVTLRITHYTLKTTVTAQYDRMPRNLASIADWMFYAVTAEMHHA